MGVTNCDIGQDQRHIFFSMEKLAGSGNPRGGTNPYT